MLTEQLKMHVKAKFCIKFNTDELVEPVNSFDGDWSDDELTSETEIMVLYYSMCHNT